MEICRTFLSKKSAKTIHRVQQYIEYYQLAKKRRPPCITVHPDEYQALKNDMAQCHHQPPFTLQGVPVKAVNTVH
ncbi:hypothetical protein [Zooshikella ganghwensis]|uniref:hypothetical protein n=1 Tax=Zooshikella ganghwensis TaxID=202772 RepID=UPI00041F332D|nr:hypothetical protein [Zooshikella ganghwensis]